MNQCFISIGTIGILICLLEVQLISQQTLCYPLEENLEPAGIVLDAPPLARLPNAQGENGSFISTELTAEFCPSGGPINAFHFEDNVGLAFDNNAADLIDCEYTVEFLVNFEELPASQLFDSPWIWIFGTYEDDDGLFIWREILFGGIFIEFWDSNDRLQTIPFNNFNTTDWFHFTITRNCTGQVKLFIDCELFTTFNDTRNILRLHPSTGNRMLFFQDDPSLTQNDAAPGKVRDIKIANFIKEETEIAKQCDCLCESLTTECVIEISRDSMVCDPIQVGTEIDTIPFLTSCSFCDSIVTTNFILSPAEACQPVCEEVFSLDTLLCAGSLYNSIMITQDTVICDTSTVDSACTVIACMNIQLLPASFSQLDTFICAGESITIEGIDYSSTGIYDIALKVANACDSTLTLNLTVLDGQTVTIDTMVCPGTFLGNVMIQNDTSFCEMVSGGQLCQMTYCYQVATYPSVLSQIQETFCSGDSWLFGDTLLTRPGIYNRSFIDRNGCDSLVQLQLDTLSYPSITIDTILCLGTVFKGVLVLSDTLVCETVPDEQSCFVNTCYRVTADIAFVYERKEQVCKGGTFTLGDSIYKAPGTYLHRLKASNGCDSIIALALSERLPPLVSIIGSSTVCPGKTSVLNAGGGFTAYQWLPTGDTTQIIEIQTPGTYTVRVTDEFGCQNERSVEVTSVPPVEVDIELLQPELCPGSNDAALQAVAFGGSPPFSYLWSDGSDKLNLMDIPAGIYHVIVRDEEGCSDRDTVIVESGASFVLQTDIFRPSCPESDDGVISVQAVGANGPFLYQFDQRSMSPDSVFADLSQGTYALTAEDLNGCQQELTIDLLAEPGPSLGIDLSATKIVEGDSVRLDLIYDDPSGIRTISWIPAEVVNCDTCLTVTAYPDSSITITAIIITNDNCMASASVFIEVESEPDDLDEIIAGQLIFVPNAFSPNGDGVNDQLTVYGRDDFKEPFSMKIFNRWGISVYEQKNLSVSDIEPFWDGKINGTDAPAGVYLWSIVPDHSDGLLEPISGQLTLIR